MTLGAIAQKIQNLDRNTLIKETPGSVILFFLYVVTALLGFTFNPVSGFAALIWPPAGIALAAVYLFGYRMLPAVFLGALAANYINGAPVLAALGIGIGNTLEALGAIYILKKFRIENSLERVRDIFVLIIFGALISPVIAASIGTASLLAAGLAMPGTYALTWGAWWLGDALGILVITPLALTWYREVPRLRPRQYLELLLLAAFLIPPSAIIFYDESRFLFAYLVFLPLLFAAVRFGQRMTTVSILFIMIAAVWGLTGGLGPFSENKNVVETLFKFQLFMGVVISTSTVLAATAAERRRGFEELRLRTEELERHKKTLELRTVKDLALINGISEGIAAVDHEGKIFLANRALEGMLQCPYQKLLGVHIDRAVELCGESGDPFPAEERPSLRSIAERKEISCDSCLLRRRDGTLIPVAATASPFMIGDQIFGAVMVFRNIQKEKEIDRAKNEFVSLASHQLRTPLSIINWHLEAVLDSDRSRRLSAQKLQYINESYAATKRIFKMVNALLAISRLEANTYLIQPKSVDIAACLEKLLKEFSKEAAKKHLRLEKRIYKSLPKVTADLSALQMALENLLSNAISYTPPGGRIRVSAARRNGSVRISVADTGYGIPEELQDKIFTKFFRAENVALQTPDGNGLGLYLAKAVLDRSGGTLSFTSRENKGTTFYISLPLA